jgi:hypothetical protein
MNKHYSRGFGAVELIAIVVVVGLMGLVSYKFWDATHKKDTTASTTPTVSKVESAKDLTTVSKELDAVDVTSSFESDLSSESSF